jgi:hypothetical protein
MLRRAPFANKFAGHVRTLEFAACCASFTKEKYPSRWMDIFLW